MYRKFLKLLEPNFNRRRPVWTGDTLVEVLISIAIISLVVTGAYALANHSLQQGITASEHTEALKLAEGQVEALKFRQQNTSLQTFRDSFGGSQPTSPLNYCLNTDSTGPNDTTNQWAPYTNGDTVGGPSSLTLKTNGGDYDPACLDKNQSKYYMNISLPSRGDTGHGPVFLISVRWNAIGGGVDQSQLYYKF